MSGRFHRATAYRVAAVWLATAILAGCGSTPSLGPNVSELIDESRAAKRFGFALVNVDDGVLRAIAGAPQETMRQFFPDDHAATPRIGPGDVLSITVYEPGAAELFAPPSAQQLSYGTASAVLPAITVDTAGDVNLPFAGAIRVAGLTTAAAQRAIRRRLGGKGIEPEILVAVTKDATNVVTVTGTVKNPGRYAITPAGETLVQIVAEAGGPTNPATDTVLQLTRKGREAAVRLSDLLSFPRQDIHLRPGDYVNLAKAPRVFLIYGAVYRSGVYPLAADNINLTLAIGTGGGMVDALADSRGVFVFRFERPEAVRNFPAGQVVAPAVDGGAARIPVIYRFDMKTAAGIFHADTFRLRDHDLVFVPTAETVEWEKYLDLFRLTAAPALSGASQAVILDRGF